MPNDETVRPTTARRPLRRSREDRVLGGVCGGIAHHLDLDTPLLRIGAVVLAVASGGTAILVYLAAWVLLPRGDGEEVRAPRAVTGNIGARDAWTAAGGELRSLAVGLKKAPATPTADVEAERRERSRTEAVDRMMTTLGDRLRDPDVRDGARRAAAGVSTAVAASVDEFGRRGRRNGTPAPGTPAPGTAAPGTAAPGTGATAPES